MFPDQTIVQGNFWRHNSIGSKAKVHVAENCTVAHCGRAIDQAGTHMQHTTIGSLCITCLKQKLLKGINSGAIQL